MLVTHGSIGKLLEGGSESPQSVDALALARLQIEGLFSMCVLTEKSDWVDVFLRDGWKKQFVRYLLFKYETECLPRFGPNAYVPELSRLVKFSGVCNVSLAQIHTVEHQQTGMPMPTGMRQEKIPEFPMPSGVNDMEIVAGVTDAWNDLLGATFVVNAVWNIRTKALLGVIG